MSTYSQNKKQTINIPRDVAEALIFVYQEIIASLDVGSQNTPVGLIFPNNGKPTVTAFSVTIKHTIETDDDDRSNKGTAVDFEHSVTHCSSSDRFTSSVTRTVDLNFPHRRLRLLQAFLTPKPAAQDVMSLHFIVSFLMAVGRVLRPRSLTTSLRWIRFTFFAKRTAHFLKSTADVCV